MTGTTGVTAAKACAGQTQLGLDVTPFQTSFESSFQVTQMPDDGLSILHLPRQRVLSCKGRRGQHDGVNEQRINSTI